MLTSETFLDADYAALDRALTSLGFTKTVTEEAILYRHQATDSFLAFPPASPEEKVDLMNMISVRNAVLYRGVASFEEYWNAFVKASEVRKPRPKGPTTVTEHTL
jgi:hypothetical protein